jgi:hypothetical protein
MWRISPQLPTPERETAESAQVTDTFSRLVSYLVQEKRSRTIVSEQTMQGGIVVHNLYRTYPWYGTKEAISKFVSELNFRWGKWTSVYM